MKLKNLTQEEKDQLKSYINSVKEIKKEINGLLEKAGCTLREDAKEGDEEDKKKIGGNRSSGLTLDITKEEIDLNEYDQLLGAIENLLNQKEKPEDILQVVKDALGYK
jgi:hypothetical protein